MCNAFYNFYFMKYFNNIKEILGIWEEKIIEVFEHFDNISRKKLISFCDHIDKFKEIYKYNFFGLCFLIFVFANRLFIEKIPKNLEIFYMILAITSLFVIIIQSVYLYNV